MNNVHAPNAGGSSAYWNILSQESRDSHGQRFVDGLIQYCRQWKTRDPLYAFHAYTQHLLDAGTYDELRDVVLSEFLPSKANALSSIFPVLEDITYLTTAARDRGDFYHYGISLGLHSSLWERGTAQLGAGAVLFLAQQGRIQEAVTNSRNARDAKEAFDLLLSVLQAVDATRTDALAKIAKELLDCVRHMDNEGTRAHHLHRVLYALRLKNETLALNIVPECRQIANDISDTFQRLVSNLLLVQQVAPLNLDLAEDIARAVMEVTEETFIGEVAQTLLTLAALGRHAEDDKTRLDRLERLLKHADGLQLPKYWLETSTALLLEIFWTQPQLDTLRRLVKTVAAGLPGVLDKHLSDLLKDLFAPDPITVNNATSPYRDGDVSLHGVVEARRLTDVMALLSGSDEEVLEILTDLADAWFLRISQVSDSQKQKDILGSLTSRFCELAIRWGVSSGARLLGYIESSLERRSNKGENLFHLLDLAVGWYQLGFPERGQEMLQRCVHAIDHFRERIAAMSVVEPEAEDDNPLAMLRARVSRLLQAHETLRKMLSGEYAEAERELLDKQKERLREKLAGTLLKLPQEQRLAAYQQIKGILEYDREYGALQEFLTETLPEALGGLPLAAYHLENTLERVRHHVTSTTPESMVACALADVDVGLAVQIVEKIEGELESFHAAAALASHIGERQPERASEVVDSVAVLTASRKVAKDICTICTALHPMDVPHEVWLSISSSLRLLKECPARTLASQMCAVRVAEHSTSEARKIGRRELETLSGEETPEAKNLKVLQNFLEILEGESVDLDALVAACRELTLGGRTRKLVHERVAPQLAIQEPKRAVDILQAVGELKIDLSAVAETVLRLIGCGAREAARGVIRYLAEIPLELAEDKQSVAFRAFLARIADSNDVNCLRLAVEVAAGNGGASEREQLLADLAETLRDRREVPGIWQWLLEESRGFLDRDRSRDIDLSHAVYMAAIEPRGALSRWFEVHNASGNILVPMIARAIQTDAVVTLEMLSALPNCQAKAYALMEAYHCLSQRPDLAHIVTLAPPPFSLLHDLDSPADRARLLANYMALTPELDAGILTTLIATIKDVPLPADRRAPIEAVIQRLPASHHGALLRLLGDSVIEAYRHRTPDDQDSDDELCEWAYLAGTLSFKVAFAILKKVRDPFTRRHAAGKLLQRTFDVAPETLIELADDFDAFDKRHFVQDVATHLWIHDPAKGQALLDSLGPFLDEDDRARCLEQVREAVSKEQIKRAPDAALLQVRLINGRDKQADRLKEILTILAEHPQSEITRWDALLEMIDAWAQAAASPAAAGFKYLKAIATYAPDVSYERFVSKPEGDEKIEAGIALLQAVRRPEHINLLKVSIAAYSHILARLQQEREESFRSQCQRCLENLKERICQWDSDTVDAAVPTLVPFLADFPGSRAQRDKVLLELLKRLSVDRRDWIQRLLGMIDTPEAQSEAGAIIITRLPADRLQEGIQLTSHCAATVRTAADEAAKVLGDVIERLWRIPLGLPYSATSPGVTDARDVEAFSLIATSYVAFRRLLHPDRSLLFAFFKCLHRITVQSPHADYLVSLFLQPDGPREGLDADDTGKAIGTLLASLASLPDDIASQDATEIIRLITEDDHDQSLPSLLGTGAARFHGDDARNFITQLFLTATRYPGDARYLVKRCMAAFLDSCSDGGECFAHVLMMVEGLRGAAPDMRRYFADEAVVIGERLAVQDDEIKTVLPVLRIFLASELFLPEFPLDCFQWMRRGLHDLIAYSTSHELTQEVFGSLEYICACLGRLVVLRQCSPEILSKIELHVSQMLVILATLEATKIISGPSQVVENRLLQRGLQIILKDFDILEQLCTGSKAPLASGGALPGREPLSRRLLRIFRRDHAFESLQRPQRSSLMKLLLGTLRLVASELPAKKASEEPSENDASGALASEASDTDDIATLLSEHLSWQRRSASLMKRRSREMPLSSLRPDVQHDILTVMSALERRVETSRCIASERPFHTASREPSENDAGSERASEASYFLYALAAFFWKLGPTSLQSNAHEIATLMSQLAAQCDPRQLEKESRLFEVNKQFHLELFVRSLSRVDRAGAMQFVMALATKREKLDDFGLFDEVLLDDPAWVFERVEAWGPKGETAERVSSLVDRLAREAPAKLKAVALQIRRMVSHHGDWMFKSTILESLDSALARIDPTETMGTIDEIPEFWGRSRVRAGLIQTAWRREPLKTLETLEEIELAEVRRDTLVECAKAISSLSGELPVFEILKEMMARCDSLPNAEDRFTAAREVLSALLNLHNGPAANDSSEIVYKFLELFASAPPDWLCLAFVHAVPILSRHLGKDAVSQIGHGITCGISMYPTGDPFMFLAPQTTS